MPIETEKKEQYVLNSLQEEIRLLLESFLNEADLTRLSLILSPFVDSFSVQGRLRKITSLLEELNFKKTSEFLMAELKAAAKKEKISSNKLCKIVSGLYVFLDSVFIKCPSGRKEIEVASFSSWQKKVKDSKYLRPVFMLNQYLGRNLSQELSGFYLHGSLSTLDYSKGNSDFDTVAIVKDETLLNPEKLWRLRGKIKRVNNILYLLDILQHHGATILTDFEILNYPNSSFPLVLFDFSTCLGKSSQRLVVFEREAEERKSQFNDCLEYLEKISSEKKHLSAQGFKLFLSLVQLLPALYFEAKYRAYIYKKFSFDKVKEEFSKKEWEIIEKASRVREVWRYSPVFPPLFQNIFSIFPKFKSLALVYGGLIMPLSPEAKKIMGPEMIKEAYSLAKAMAAKLN